MRLRAPSRGRTDRTDSGSNRDRRRRKHFIANVPGLLSIRQIIQGPDFACRPLIPPRCSINTFFKNLDLDQEMFITLGYHSHRIQPAATIIPTKRSHMNKSELIEITAKEADISKAAAEKALSA
ncbi:MAG: hypothetical protein Q8J99_07830, partial [Sulfuritalea sp.]|nr:hypothetical protein [Sulfuritalea sp.]